MKTAPLALSLVLLASFSFAWWDPSFQYRTPINITSSVPLTDYQVQVNPQIYNNTGLVGSWHFSEGSGTRAADSSGFGNDGTLNGPAWTAGKFGNGLQFDGVNNYVDAGSAASLNIGTNPTTFELWLRSSSTAVQTAISTRNENTNGYVVQLTTSVVEFYAPSTGGVIDGSVNVLDGQWHHVVVVRAGTGNNRVYVDGVSKTLTTNTENLANPSIALNTRIGMQQVTGDSRYFNGIIDEVRIYNRSLSAQEISEHYNASKARLDYADLRFALANDTQIPYWMENDKSAWVKVPSVPAGNSTIYMYYGNASAVYNSSLGGNDTFVFFDDFNYWDRGKWERYGTGTDASVTVSDGIMRIDRTNMQTARTFSPGVVVSAVNKKGVQSSMGTGFGDANWDYAALAGHNTVLLRPSYFGAANGASYTQNNVFTTGWDVYKKRTITWASGLAVGEIDGVTNTITSYVPTVPLRLLLGEYNAGSTFEMYIDSLYVRKYSSAEPVSSLSALESAPIDSTPPSVSIQSPANSTYLNPSVQLNFTATDASGISACKYSLNGAANVTLAGCANTSITAQAGSNALAVWASDGTNWGSASVSFTLDATPPVVLIHSPLNQDYNSSSIPLNFTASDASGVTQCKYELNGTNYSLPGCANTTLTAANGSNSLRVWAYDGANWGYASVSFTVTLAQPQQSVSNATVTDANGIGNVSLLGIPPGASRIVYSVGSNSYSRSFSASSGVSSVRISARATLQGTPAAGKTLSFELS